MSQQNISIIETQENDMTEDSLMQDAYMSKSFTGNQKSNYSALKHATNAKNIEIRSKRSMGRNLQPISGHMTSVNS